MIWYGVFAGVFIDYFQIGETICCRCVSRLGLIDCLTLAEVYSKRPTKSNACNITELYNCVHKIPWMLGSLDVTKVYWKNCPTALKRQFQGQEKYATISLEARVDTNLWFWHSAFGFPRTVNVLNVWERSALFQSMTNGDHGKIDQDFTIDGQVFTLSLSCWLNISLFNMLSIGTVSDPISKLDRSFAIEEVLGSCSWSFEYSVIQSTFTTKMIYIMLLWLWSCCITWWWKLACRKMR